MAEREISTLNKPDPALELALRPSLFSNLPTDSLMPEMADAGKRHRHVPLVRRCDHFRVAH